MSGWRWRMDELVEPAGEQSVLPVAIRLRRAPPSDRRALKTVLIRLKGEKRLLNLSSSLSIHLTSSPDPTSLDETSTHSRPSTAAQAMAFFAWHPYHPNSLGAPSDIPLLPERTEIVQCRICERRVGLWSFRSLSRAFDLVEEHLVWCPIRASGGERPWWEDCAVLEPPRIGIVWEGYGGIKGVLRVSERLERKAWRRR